MAVRGAWLEHATIRAIARLAPIRNLNPSQHRHSDRSHSAASGWQRALHGGLARTGTLKPTAQRMYTARVFSAIVERNDLHRLLHTRCFRDFNRLSAPDQFSPLSG